MNVIIDGSEITEGYCKTCGATTIYNEIVGCDREHLVRCGYCGSDNMVNMGSFVLAFMDKEAQDGRN